MSEAAVSSWPLRRADEALYLLAERNARRFRPAGRVAPAPLQRPDFAHWLEQLALASGLSLLEVQCPRSRAEHVLRTASPALLLVRLGSDYRIVVVDGGRWGSVTVVDEAAQTHHHSPDQLVALLDSQNVEQGVIDRLVDLADVSDGGRAFLARRLANALSSDARIDGIFMLEDTPVTSLKDYPFKDQLAGPLARAAASHAVSTLLAAGAWLAIMYAFGRTSTERSVLVLWGLLTASAIALHVVERGAQFELSLRISTFIKRRFLVGCLAPPDSSEAISVGGAIARISDASAVESAIAAGGFTALMSVFDLVIIPLSLQWGSGGYGLGLLLVVALLVHAWVAFRLLHRRGRWTEGRLKLTEGLLERMLGHRTRLVQQVQARWHETEDQSLSQHWRDTRAFDETRAFAGVIPPRLFTLGGLSLVGLSFAFSSSSDLSVFLLGIASVMLAERALQRFSDGVSVTSDLVIAGRTLLPLLRRTIQPTTPPLLSRSADRQPTDSLLLEARDLHVKDPLRAHPVLERESIAIHRGERLLIEGPSGGGKTTVANVLAGLRQTTGGHVLLHGFDAATLGDVEWRRQVTFVPQFDRNHLFNSSLLYNLWFGRAWPPDEEGIRECKTICLELGLDRLLARMPQGLYQAVGETGWQLSHGERSRVFIARALLARPEVLILDEALGTVDPENFYRVLRCVLARAQTLVLVGHL